MKRTLVALALAVIFVLALATPAFAIVFTTTYEMEGTINFRKQAGHACNTGAEFKQTIVGSGTMDKVMTVSMVPGKLTVEDVNDWVAGATPLTVTSVWELCTPPKYTYDGLDELDRAITAPVSVGAMYGDYDVPAYWDQVAGEMVGMTVAQLAKHYNWDALTSQIWAVQVQADPGFSGNIHQKGEAAYGPFWSGDFTWEDPWTAGEWSKKDTWRWEENKDGIIVAAVGANYVGDYFTMEQMARTSQGTLRRYIDLSSPWSHAFLHEDMSVVGRSMITEAFSMNNLPAGKDVPKDWWRLF